MADWDYTITLRLRLPADPEGEFYGNPGYWEWHTLIDCLPDQVEVVDCHKEGTPVKQGFVFLDGNVSEGYEAYGPYDSLGDVSAAHEGWDGWVMQLHDPVPN